MSENTNTNDAHNQTVGSLQIAIDNALLDTALTATTLRRYYVTNQGSEVVFFANFYSAFALLVNLTVGLKDVSASLPIVKKCVEWIDPERTEKIYNKDKAIHAYALAGIELSKEYASILNAVGICSLRK